MISAGQNVSFADARMSSIALAIKLWENGTGYDQWGAIELVRYDGERLVCTAFEKVSHNSEVSAGKVFNPAQCFTYRPETPDKRTPFDVTKFDRQSLGWQLGRFKESFKRTHQQRLALIDVENRLQTRLGPLVSPWFEAGRKPTQAEIDTIVATTLDVFEAKAHCHTSAEALAPIAGTEQAMNLFDVDQCRATYFKARVGDIVLTGGWTAAVAEAPILKLVGRANDPRLMDFVVKIGDVTIAVVDLPPFAQLEQLMPRPQAQVGGRGESAPRETPVIESDPPGL